MAIDYEKLKNWSFPVLEQHYSEKDTILYALGIGVCLDPVDPYQLRYVYEHGLQVLPSMAAVLVHPGLWMAHPDTGIDMLKVVHGEQKIRIHSMLAPSGTVIGNIRVTHVIDKGADKGALVVVQRDIIDKRTDTLLATVEQTSFCRADGGFATSANPGDKLTATETYAPDRVPDNVCDMATRPEMALIYRLSGDGNAFRSYPS